MHRPFRGLLSVHSHYGLHTRAVTVYRDTLSEGFSHFVTSIAAPVASGWSGLPGGTCTHWNAPPCHGARDNQTSGEPVATGAFDPQVTWRQSKMERIVARSFGCGCDTKTAT
jgi:hypothetical protein